jgi:hypothetical protein
MIHLPTYGDERQLAFCTFCGGTTGTRDHCPSKVLLDEPYPENLPVVPACPTCNAGFSGDEEYLACLISCVIAGSSDPPDLPREKTKRILSNKPALRARIEQSQFESDGVVMFKPEVERVSAVITKLAQGHALYELHEPCARTPDAIDFRPLALMTDAERGEFESPEPASVWPEVGSRAMQRLVIASDSVRGQWLEVQPERYRLHASPGNGTEIRLVIHEYLACYVRWDY